jgi:hypothetical protein
MISRRIEKPLNLGKSNLLWIANGDSALFCRADETLVGTDKHKFVASGLHVVVQSDGDTQDNRISRID